jgi:hypothetical protein
MLGSEEEAAFKREFNDVASYPRLLPLLHRRRAGASHRAGPLFFMSRKHWGAWFRTRRIIAIACQGYVTVALPTCEQLIGQLEFPVDEALRSGGEAAREGCHGRLAGYLLRQGVARATGRAGPRATGGDCG